MTVSLETRSQISLRSLRLFDAQAPESSATTTHLKEFARIKGVVSHKRSQTSKNFFFFFWRKERGRGAGAR